MPAPVGRPSHEELIQDFSLAQTSELGMVLSYERDLADGAGKVLLDAFIHKDRAWLYYWQADEYGGYNDIGFQSYNPTSVEPDSVQLPYTLDNGQVDWYPYSWTIPIDEALRAVEYFLSGEGEMAPWISWREW